MGKSNFETAVPSGAYYSGETDRRIAELEARCQSLAAHVVLDESQLAALKARLAEVEGLLGWVLSPDFYAGSRDRRNKPIKAFLANAPSDFVMVNRRDILGIIHLVGAKSEVGRLLKAACKEIV